jgi:hypothetical protein
MDNKTMATHKALTTYLNDHLAGSVAALEIVDHLTDQTGGPGWDSSLSRLRREIDQDQAVLRRLLKRLGGNESPVRKAAAWLSEKLGEVKLRLDDSGDGEFKMLEGLEALCLGIQGKLALWRALAAAANGISELKELDYPQLERRGTEQFAQADRLRLEIARAALTR